MSQCRLKHHCWVAAAVRPWAAGQNTIDAQCRPGFEGALVLDGAEIPESDLYREPSLYQIELRPEEGSIFADLTPGRHCASIVFWPAAQGRQAASSQQWCFNLH